jgi:hypothetical protein
MLVVQYCRIGKMSLEFRNVAVPLCVPILGAELNIFVSGYIFYCFLLYVICYIYIYIYITNKYHISRSLLLLPYPYLGIYTYIHWYCGTMT